MVLEAASGWRGFLDYPVPLYSSNVTTLPSLRVRRLVASAALGLGALAVAPPASASPESDAKDLFARGRDLRNANDCGSAAPLFRKAWQIYPQGLGSLRNLAECEEALGHFASSRRAWLDLKRALITAPNDPKYDGWDKDAEESAARLKPKVASFVVDVYVKSPEGEALANESTGVEIFVNGESVGTALVGTPLERDPGTYRIRAQTTDAQPVEQTVTLSAGGNHGHAEAEAGGSAGGGSLDAADGRLDRHRRRSGGARRLGRHVPPPAGRARRSRRSLLHAPELPRRSPRHRRYGQDDEHAHVRAVAGRGRRCGRRTRARVHEQVVTFIRGVRQVGGIGPRRAVARRAQRIGEGLR